MTGSYMCSVQGLDSLGHPVSVSDTVTIQLPPENKRQLLNYLRDMDQELTDTKEKLSACSQTNWKVNLTSSQLSRLEDKSSFINYTWYQGHVYALSEDLSLNMTEYESVCHDLGGYVVEINSEEEFNFLTNFITTSGIDNDDYVMLGGTDANTEGKWVYPSSGAELSFIKWGDFAPDGGPSWNCLRLFTGNMKMYDSPCLHIGRKDVFVHLHIYMFVCEI